MATSSSSVATVTTACLMAAVGKGGNHAVDHTYLLPLISISLHSYSRNVSPLLQRNTTNGWLGSVTDFVLTGYFQTAVVFKI